MWLVNNYFFKACDWPNKSKFDPFQIYTYIKVKKKPDAKSLRHPIFAQFLFEIMRQKGR